MRSVLISAGDASGDQIAADFVRALRERSPTTRFLGLTGREMEAAGVERVADQRSLAVGGFGELLPEAPRIVGAWRKMVAALRRVEPDLVVLIDSGGFNLPFAGLVRRRSRARILYFVPPQVWAWRKGRLARLARRSDRIAVVLPFEPAFYASEGVEVDFVGHPILDRSVPLLDAGERRRARARLGFAGDRPLVGLFPGSRRNELARHLGRQLAAVAQLRQQRPDLAELEVVIGLAASLDRRDVERQVRETGVRAKILQGSVALLDVIDVALAKPGTITLELMLRERPMVVMGRAQALSAAILRRSLRVDWMAMPNLIAGKEIVPELLQSAARPDRIADALAPLFARHGGASGQTEEAARQVDALRRAGARLGVPGATSRVAEIAEELLGTDRT